jgi:hypothetical protein
VGKRFSCSLGDSVTVYSGRRSKQGLFYYYTEGNKSNCGCRNELLGQQNCDTNILRFRNFHSPWYSIVFEGFNGPTSGELYVVNYDAVLDF